MSGLLSAHHCCSRHIITIVDIESKLVRTKVVPPAPVRVATLVWMAAWCSPAKKVIVYKLVTATDSKYTSDNAPCGSFKFAYFLLKSGQSFVHIQAKPSAIEAK